MSPATTEGSAPSSTVGNVYHGPVSVGANMTLKAIAYMAGMTDSSVSTATYTITAAITGGGTVGSNGPPTGSGAAWYNATWTNRKAVTIDH
ncbi:MAG: FN3 associated domain-containing protein, partial [Actinomycetota bacterium]